jgi:hypothetical protein
MNHEQVAKELRARLDKLEKTTSIFVRGTWADDVEETPLRRLFRYEAWLVTNHADAPDHRQCAGLVCSLSFFHAELFEPTCSGELKTIG